jgi:large subunit ribosomal protein L9
MKVILSSDLRNLGKKGDLKEVSEGYARNFLIPKKLAEIATPEAIQSLRNIQESKVKQEKVEEESLKKIAFSLQGKKIILKAKSEKEKLFGSIGKREIAEELKKENFNISEKSIVLEDSIKTIGEKEILIDFGKNIKTKITVAIEKD